MNINILPGSIVSVYDRDSDKYMKAVVRHRYGFVSEFIKKLYGYEAAQYPDVIDVTFLHNGKQSDCHFTSCAE